MKSNPSFDWGDVELRVYDIQLSAYLNKILPDGIADVEDISRERIARSVGILKFRDFLVSSPDRDFQRLGNGRIIAT